MERSAIRELVALVGVLVLLACNIHLTAALSSPSLVHEDILARPQYEVRFQSELIANSSLARLLATTDSEVMNILVCVIANYSYGYQLRLFSSLKGH